MGERRCDLCKGKLVKVDTRVVAGTTYELLKCEECHHEVARHLD